MTWIQIALVLLSCFTQVYWNYEIKRSAEPQSFSWGVQLFGGLLVLPLAMLTTPWSVPPQGWWCVAGTGVCYALYFALVAKSYERGDLSVGYPIIRGIAVALVAVLGVLFFQERPSVQGAVGVVFICLAVLLLARPRDRVGAGGATFALVGGATAAGYSLVDKAGVHYVDPLLYLPLTMLAGAVGQGVLLAPKRKYRLVLGQIGPRLVLSSLAASFGYLLVLRVLQTAPVSYVIPVRSTVVLLSVFVGAKALSERVTPVRYLSSFLIVAGIVAIALAR